MSSSFVLQLREARTRAKWPTVIASILFFILSFLYEIFLVDHSPRNYGAEPYLVLAISLRLFLLVTFLLGIFTFPRWYSFLAFAAVLWMFQRPVTSDPIDNGRHNKPCS
jgi:hypothetical protein